MGMHLGTELTALEAVGEGKVIKEINTLLGRFKDNAIACYQIDDNEIFVEVKVLFMYVSKNDDWFKYRVFEYNADLDRVEDRMQKILKYSAGISEYFINDFFKLQQFYLENTSEKVVEGEE